MDTKTIIIQKNPIVQVKITFLGTGTSQGVPVIGCKCDTCLSIDNRDKRLRSSVLIQAENQNIVIDAGPDFRQQMLQHHVENLDAILITHPHKDHIGGMDDVRAFNFIQNRPMDVFIKKSFINRLKNEFYYAFDENKYPGVPEILVHPIANHSFNLNNIEIIPIVVSHFNMKIMGFRIHDFVYITDANKIETKELKKIMNAKVLVLNAIRKEKHYAHFNLSEALQIINIVKPQRAYLTHISHMMGKHAEVENELAENVHLAYDGLKITID